MGNYGSSPLWRQSIKKDGVSLTRRRIIEVFLSQLTSVASIFLRSSIVRLITYSGCQKCQAAPRPGPWRKILYKRWPARQSLEGQRLVFLSLGRSEAASEPLSLRTCYRSGAHAYRMRHTIETCHCPSSTVAPDTGCAKNPLRKEKVGSCSSTTDRLK